MSDEQCNNSETLSVNLSNSSSYDNEDDISDCLSDSNSITITPSMNIPNDPLHDDADASESDEESNESDLDSEETCLNKTFSVLIRPSELHQNNSTEKLTLPILSKYQKVKVLAFRAAQITQNAPIYAQIDPDDLKKMNALEIAEKELEDRKIPFKIRRFFPDNSFQDWNLNELEN